MSTWLAPSAWVNGGVSAAFATAEVQTHLVWLKAAFDLITNSTVSDVGTGTFLRIVRTNSTDSGYSSRITGDTQNRINIDAGGAIRWSSGTAAEDTRLRRTVGGGGILIDDGSGGNAAVDVTGALTQGYGGTQIISLQNGYMEFGERPTGAPTAPSPNHFLMFARDNGSGKTQACILFPTGAVLVLGTQA
jgi:hypothetical protein